MKISAFAHVVKLLRRSVPRAKYHHNRTRNQACWHVFSKLSLGMSVISQGERKSSGAIGSDNARASNIEH